MKCYLPNIKALDLAVSEMKDFEVGLLWSLFKLVTPPLPLGRASFDPRGIILKSLIEIPKALLHTKYQSSRHSSFKEEEF